MHSTQNRLPGLDLLRAVAIVWIMLYHLASYGLSFPAVVHMGWMGVDLFFVLSGYLIGWQLLQPYARGQQPNWRQFMLRRALRVLPAYLAVLAVYIAVPPLRESEGMAPPWQFLTFTANLLPDYLHNRTFSHAWSLCVEEHFYLLLPPVAWLLARRPGAIKIALVALAVFIGGMVLRGWLWQHEVAPYMHINSGENNFMLRYIEVIYNPTYTRLDGLLAGVMLAVVKAFRPIWWSRAITWTLPSLMLGLTGIYASMQLDPTSFIGSVIAFPLLSISLALVLLAALNQRGCLGRFSVPGARHIAAISFSLYLTHKQVYHWINISFGAALEGADLLAFGVYNAAALGVATLLYLAVERPGLQLRKRWITSPNQTRPLPFAA